MIREKALTQQITDHASSSLNQGHRHHEKRLCRRHRPGIATAISLCALTICAHSEMSPDSIGGTVITGGGQPVPGALVRSHATENLVETDDSGVFTLSRENEDEEIVLTAWKHNYFTTAVKTSWGASEVEIVLEPYHTTDNPEYVWASPYEGDKACAKCHAESIAKQWSANLHSQSVTNALVQTMYSGTDTNGNPESSLSYRDDFPGIPGNCAACHAPGAVADNPYGVFLDRVEGVDALGVHCDFCHKVYDARVPSQGAPGVASMTLRRPSFPGRDIFFGPFGDRAAGDETRLPLISKSRFCAPCHTHESWGVPIYQSFPEWFDSPYREKGVACQDCHNAPDGKTSNFAPGHPLGAERDPGRVPSHNMMGEDRTEFIASAISMVVEPEYQPERLAVTVRVTNSGAGHHFPTGQPMRNAILLVDARDNRGRRLDLLRGDVLPRYAGDLAGQPGRFYAKILEEIRTSYPDRPSRPVRIPAPQWVQTRIQSDTRIPALATDESHYEFAPPDAGEIRLEIRLVYRRTFRSFAEVKGWGIPDILVASRCCGIVSSTE